MKVVVTGGLTGGHVMPGITLCLALQERGHEVLFVGAEHELEVEMCVRYCVPFAGLPYQRFGALSRWGSISRCLTPAVETLRAYRPDVVFSKGSDVTIPVVLAAKKLGVPVLVHESDVIAGSETLLLSPFCTDLCLGFEEASIGLNRPYIVTGNIPRPNLAGGDREWCHRTYGFSDKKPLLFVMGGSQGAEALNRMIFAILEQLVSRYSVIHQCGRGKCDSNFRNSDYVQFAFIGDEIRHIYASSDLVLSRAGATSITEISLYGLPALYVPYPWAENDHQTHNALTAQRRGGCVMMEQRDLTAPQLLKTIDSMMARRIEYRAQYERLREERALPGLLSLIERYCPTRNRRRGRSRTALHLSS